MSGIELKAKEPIARDAPSDEQTAEAIDCELKYDNHLVEGEQFTDMLLNRPPTQDQAKVLMFLLFFMIGMIQWYQGAIVLDLQEKGATYKDQSFFSFAIYPYLFKIIFAPLIDLYYFEKIGKCKSYIVSSGLLMGVCFLLMAPRTESLVHPNSLYQLTGICFLLNFMAVFFQIAGEMWVVKIFHENEKSKGGMLYEVGTSVGGFLTYNVFVPLSSLKWLNENIFKSSPLTSPILTHKSMMYFMGSILLVFALLVLLLVGERKIESSSNPMTVGRLFRSIPKYFTNPHLRSLLIVIAATRAFSSMIAESMALKFLDNGIKKATLVNIDTVTYPIYLIGSCFIVRLIVKGKLMKYFNWMMLYATVIALGRFCVLLYLMTSKNIDSTIRLIFAGSLIQNLCFPFVFLMGFINIITPESVGSTFITFFMCWCNLTSSVPATIGLRLVDSQWVNYNALVVGCLLLQIVCIVYSFSLSNKLDQTQKFEYSFVTIDSTSAANPDLH